MKNLLQLTCIPLLMLSLQACEQQDANLALGQLTYDRIELRVESDEPVATVAVREGDEIHAGQVLLLQDTRRAELKLADAEAALAEAAARQQELTRGPREEQILAARAALQGADDDLAFRASEFDRTKDIAARGLASDDALDRARAALDVARSNRDLLAARLQELLTGTTVEELRQAEANVQRATATRDLAILKVERHTLTSPLDGIVDSRRIEPGERPAASQVVLTLLPNEQAYARVYVPAALRPQIHNGAPARISVDGYNNDFAGTVRWVSDDASFTPYFALSERDRGRLSYVAHIDITGTDARLPSGTPVEARFGNDD